MARLIKAGETTDARKKVYFHLVEDDGITPVTGKGGEQPQASIDGSAWGGAGTIGTLAEIGNGRYYAILTDATVAVGNLGRRIETRFKDADTAECVGDSVDVVDFDPYDAMTIKSDATAANQAAIKARTDRIGALEVTYQSPATEAGSFDIFAGDDYKAADSRALEVTISDYAGADLTDATCKLRLTAAEGFTESQSAAEVEVTAGIAVNGSTVTVSADLTAAQTTAMGTYPPETQRNYVFQFIATLAITANVVTLAHGRCTVRQKIATAPAE